MTLDSIGALMWSRLRLNSHTNATCVIFSALAGFVERHARSTADMFCRASHAIRRATRGSNDESAWDRGTRLDAHVAREQKRATKRHGRSALTRARPWSRLRHCP